jgi:hypothetical protein
VPHSTAPIRIWDMGIVRRRHFPLPSSVFRLSSLVQDCSGGDGPLALAQAPNPHMPHTTRVSLRLWARQTANPHFQVAAGFLLLGPWLCLLGCAPPPALGGARAFLLYKWTNRLLVHRLARLTRSRRPSGP